MNDYWFSIERIIDRIVSSSGKDIISVYVVVKISADRLMYIHWIFNSEKSRLELFGNRIDEYTWGCKAWEKYCSNKAGNRKSSGEKYYRYDSIDIGTGEEKDLPKFEKMAEEIEKKAYAIIVKAIGYNVKNFKVKMSKSSRETEYIDTEEYSRVISKIANTYDILLKI